MASIKEQSPALQKLFKWIDEILLKQRIAYHEHDAWQEHPVAVKYHQEYFARRAGPSAIKDLFEPIAVKNPEFKDFIKQVRAAFLENKNDLLSFAQGIIPEAGIINVRLIGSYAKGNPREDSDIDLEIEYRGDMEPKDLADKLRGKLVGYGGVYDIVPRKKDIPIAMHSVGWTGGIGEGDLDAVEQEGLIIGKHRSRGTIEYDVKLGRKPAIYTFSFDGWAKNKIPGYNFEYAVFVAMTTMLQSNTEVHDSTLTHRFGDGSVRRQWKAAKRRYGEDISHISNPEYATLVNIPPSNLIMGRDVLKQLGNDSKAYYDKNLVEKTVKDIVDGRQKLGILKSSIEIHVWRPEEPELQKDFGTAISAYPAYTTEPHFPEKGHPTKHLDTGIKLKESDDFPDPASEEIYDWIDLQLGGVDIGGEQPYGAKIIGKNIEQRLYNTLEEDVKEYMDSLQGTETEFETVQGVEDVVRKWGEANAPKIAEAFQELFRRGFSAGAIAAGKMGTYDKLAAEILEKDKYRIGSRIRLFGDDAIKEFRGIIKQAYTPEGKFNLDYWVEEMNKAVPSQRYKLERIARTETSNVSNLGRIWGWGQDPDRYYYQYFWSSTPDARRKLISKWRAEESPYDFDGIKFLWLHQEEQRDENWQADQYNQRCSLVRTPVNEEFKEPDRFTGKEHMFHNTTEIAF